MVVVGVGFMMDNHDIQDNSNNKNKVLWWCGVAWCSNALASLVELKEEWTNINIRQILQRYLLYIVMAYDIHPSHLIL